MKNAPEWWIILFGLVAAAVGGCIFPSFAIFFGEVLEVFARPKDEVLDAIHPWAVVFLAIGIGAALSIFFKVIYQI